MNRKRIIIFISIIIAVGLGIFFYDKKPFSPTANIPDDRSFIEDVAEAPAVSGNIVNSGIMGRVLLADGKPFEANLDIFRSNDLSKPFISVRSNPDGSIQIPLKPDSYIIKPSSPYNGRGAVRAEYPVLVGRGQWLRVKIEYK